MSKAKAPLALSKVTDPIGGDDHHRVNVLQHTEDVLSFGSTLDMSTSKGCLQASALLAGPLKVALKMVEDIIKPAIKDQKEIRRLSLASEKILLGYLQTWSTPLVKLQRAIGTGLAEFKLQEELARREEQKALQEGLDREKLEREKAELLESVEVAELLGEVEEAEVIQHDVAELEEMLETDLELPVVPQGKAKIVDLGLAPGVRVEKEMKWEALNEDFTGIGADWVVVTRKPKVRDINALVKELGLAAAQKIGGIRVWEAHETKVKKR